jgi:hypothetical protein
MTSFRDLFPVPRPIVAMAYVPPLPGTPLCDESRGVNGLVEAVRADLEIPCCASDAWRASWPRLVAEPDDRIRRLHARDTVQLTS